MQTAISCITNFDTVFCNGIQDQRAGTPPRSLRVTSRAGCTARFVGVPGGCRHAWPAVSLGDALGAHGAALHRGARSARFAPAASSSLFPLPKAAPNRPRGSILLSQRGPTGLTVKRCSPPRLRLSALPPPTAAPAPQPLLMALASLRARPARLALPPCPRPVPRLVTPVRLPPGWQVRGVPQAPLRLGGAAATSVAGARAGIPSGRRGAKFSVMSSFALPCGSAATTPRPTSTSTTTATPSCSCAPTLVEPVPLSCLTDVDELIVALGCRFALDVTIAQQVRPLADPTAFSMGGRARLLFWFFWLLEVCMKVRTNLNGLRFFEASSHVRSGAWPMHSWRPPASGACSAEPHVVVFS